MNLYSYIEDITSEYLFLYSVIFVALLYYFKNINISLNVLFVCVITLFIIIYTNDKEKIISSTKKENNKIKLNEIKPRPKNINEHSEIIDFLFSIQDFHIYNPQAYEEMIDYIDIFFSIYESIKITPKNNNKFFSIIEQRKHDALNSLHSLIFTIPSDKNMTNKLNISINTLEELLNKYLNEIYHIHNEYLYNTGYNIEHKPLENNIGPKANNFYKNELFTFDYL
jgi:hypothetical protein